MNEIRWDDKMVKSTRDGIDLRSLELSKSDEMGIQLIRDYEVVNFLNSTNARGKGLEKMMLKYVKSSAALGLLSMPKQNKKHFLNGGMALQRLWLEAARLGLSFQPLVPCVFLFARSKQNALSDFSVQEQKELKSYQLRFEQIINESEAKGEAIFLFRLFRAEKASHKALRRPLEEVLSYRL